MPIRLRDVNFTYAPGTAWARPVLRGVDLDAAPGECLGILGPIGSGKTTLIRHLNGLLLPDSGTVQIGEVKIRRGMSLPGLLSGEVGVVFQFPEKQIFAETVGEDVASGLQFAGIPSQDIPARVARALARVGIDAGEYGGRAPFTLTWGEKRKVAIAGVLALEAPRLVFDEPGAGLDPAGREKVVSLIADLVKGEGKTVVIVSHHLDDLFRVADRLAVLAEGRVVFQGSFPELCRRADVNRWGMRWPPLVELMRNVAETRPGLRVDVRTPEEAVASLKASGL